MSFPDFQYFYKVVTGRSPFRWQVELANDLCDNKWIDLLCMPTGGGKTAILEAWFHALAYGSYHGNRQAPLRLFYTVDRRLLIDSVYEAAKRLQNKLQTPELKLVREAIQNHLGTTEVLAVGRMRGGLQRNLVNKWCMDGSYLPNTPAIVSTSVDQLGSRLLMRGYGIGSKGRAIQASLAAIDSLILLDESHLSEAFYNTLSCVNQTAELGSIPKSRVLQMSATPSNNQSYTYSISDDPAIQQRVNIFRPVKLVQCGVGIKNIAPTMAQEGYGLLNDKRHTVAIVCNTVDMARAVFKQFQAKKYSHCDVVLLTGRIRQREQRDNLRVIRSVMSGWDRSKTRRPLIVVSTQTIEVGLDLDFDAMVSESAPLDCLRQRFGRLDRIGVFGGSQGVIVQGVAIEEKDVVVDYIYGEQSLLTFTYLKTYGMDIPDFNDVVMKADLFAKKPPLSKPTPQVVNVLAHTHPDVPVDLDAYLHGVQDKASDFTLIYRKELNFLGCHLRKNKIQQYQEWVTKEEQCKAWLSLTRPNHAERLRLPLSVIYAKRDSCDVQGVYPGFSQPSKTNLLGKELCVRRKDFKVIRFWDIKPGDEVYVPTWFGKYDQYGWNPKSSDMVEDVLESQGQIFRLHPWFTPAIDFSTVLVKGRLKKHELIRQLKAKKDQFKNENRKRWYHFLRKTLRTNVGYHLTPDKQGLYLFTIPTRIHMGEELDGHCRAVGQYARQVAESLGFSDALCKLMELAGTLHDIGKGEPRFQKTLHYPNRFSGEFLAKSHTKHRQTFLPMSWRHELQSLAMIIENNLDNCDDKPLLHHLVRAHHGWRNSCPPVDDVEFRSFSYKKWKSTQSFVEAVGNSQDFHALNQKYGVWGLAFLETIIRLSDYKGSNP